MEHHAYVVTGEGESGVNAALHHAEKELGLKAHANPDVIVFRYGLLAVEEVRKIIAVAAQAPVGGERKAIVIAASRIYHEAQNALLKLFEEPPRGTTLYLVIPEAGQLLPTLRSRVQIVGGASTGNPTVPESVQAFLNMSSDQKSVFIKKLTSATDEDARRAARDEALALVNGIEALAYTKKGEPEVRALLGDISLLRGYLYDRAAPVKMILEHLALTIPRGLAK